jgi:hypothetical protein
MNFYIEQPKSRLVNLSFSYVQGMNVLAAPFLYVMPELEAFACFTSFLTYSCPLYIQVIFFFIFSNVFTFSQRLKVFTVELNY